MAPDRVRVDPYSRQAWAGDRLLELTPTQWRLLAALVAQAGVAMAWHRLAAAISPDRPISVNAVRVTLSALRRRLGPGYIRTVLRVGPCFTKDLADDVYVGVEAA